LSPTILLLLNFTSRTYGTLVRLFTIQQRVTRKWNGKPVTAWTAMRGVFATHLYSIASGDYQSQRLWA